MKELTKQQLAYVSGAGDDEGGDAADAARNVCVDNNLPADTAVTITFETGGSLGFGSTNTTVGSTVEIETTCGDLTSGGEGG